MTIDDKPWSEEMGDDQVKWIANEGVRISAIIRALAEARMEDPAQQAMLRSLLDATADPADEINQVLAAERGGEARPAVEQGRRDSGGIGAMEFKTGGATFSFSGPVTINVYPGAGASGLPGIAAALEKSLRFDPDYEHREGYNPAFLGGAITVPLPAVAPERDTEMYKVDGAILVLPYHHYSLAMNRVRRLQMWSAANVDYDPAMRKTGGRTSFGSDRWVGDPRIPAAVQLAERDIYGPARTDRPRPYRAPPGQRVGGDAGGGGICQFRYLPLDQLHAAACRVQPRQPPTTRYGQLDGLWGSFEEYVQSDLQKGDTRACVLAGPVLALDDPVAEFGGQTIQYPVTFWKVVAVAEAVQGGTANLRTYGFVMSQKDVVDRFGIEFSPGRYARFQKPLADIGALAGIVFDPLLMAADATGFSNVDTTP